MKLTHSLLCLFVVVSSALSDDTVVNPRGARPIEHGYKAQDTCKTKEWQMCTDDDWGNKCPSGCRVQGLMDKADHDIIKKIENIRRLLDEGRKLYRSADQVSKNTYSYLRERLTSSAGNDNRYTTLAEQLRQRITDIKIKIDRQLRLLDALKSQVKDQVIVIQRLEVDIDIKLRTCKGSCASYTEFSVDRESYAALDKQMDHLNTLRVQNVETVSSLGIMKSRPLKDLVLPSIYKSGTGKAEQKQLLFGDVGQMKLTLEAEGSTAESAATVSKFPTSGTSSGSSSTSHSSSSTSTSTSTTSFVVTTPLQCQDTEEYHSCSTSKSRCQQSCMAFRAANHGPCLEDDLPCVPACLCKPGFYRNSEGTCVPERQCQCYPPGHNSSVPIGYSVRVSDCFTCMCLDKGYICDQEAGCCQTGVWSPWTECSARCGTGTQSRTRHNKGDCAEGPVETETIRCGQPCECENGTEWTDNCQQCKCEDGFSNCRPFCEEVTEETCDPKRGVIVPDPEQPCCQKCVPLQTPPCRPVTERTLRLNFTDPALGLCVSPPLQASRCQGACADSFTAMAYVRTGSGFSLVEESGSCQCCQPSLLHRQVTFRCGPAQEERALLVPYVAACTCMACVAGTGQ